MIEQPRGECINATNSTLQLRWFAPDIIDQCRDQLTAFSTINYTVSYHAVSTPNQIMEVREQLSVIIVLVNPSVHRW